MKIYTIVGTRPNFIKIDPELPQTIIHTGQHWDYQMSETFFKELKLPKPKYNLNCESHEIGRMMERLFRVFRADKPDMVLVFGDTLSSAMGALTARYMNIPVAHIEAGLRSFNEGMPEEINRILIDRFAKIKFCPNVNAQMNLAKEGLIGDAYVVGDPSFDAFARFLPLKPRKDYRTYSLLTIHRDFNADNKEKLIEIFSAIEESKEKFVFPVHPRTEKNMLKFKITLPKNIKMVSPRRYSDFLHLESNAKRILTDSGGVQREAFWMNVPVIIIRQETEWTEIIQKGAGILAYTKEAILDAIRDFKGKLNTPPKPEANKKIREILYRYA